MIEEKRERERWGGRRDHLIEKQNKSLLNQKGPEEKGGCFCCFNELAKLNFLMLKGEG
jgi:hypothetical protein